LRFLNKVEELTAKHSDPAPDSFDWREKGAVNPVKNQGGCGSCWAFSAIGNIEGQYFRKTGSLIRFSEQQLVDCDKVDEGCNGGLMESAFKHLSENGGVMLEDDYQYAGFDDDCKFEQTKAKAGIASWKFAKSQDEGEIKQMLYETGPLAVALNATPLQFYFFGVFDPWFQLICDPASLNHGVVIVGYGRTKNMVFPDKDYWIVRNSWSSWWGESGYFRIVRGSGACGINTYVISAEVSPK